MRVRTQVSLLHSPLTQTTQRFSLRLETVPIRADRLSSAATWTGWDAHTLISRLVRVLTRATLHRLPLIRPTLSFSSLLEMVPIWTKRLSSAATWTGLDAHTLISRPGQVLFRVIPLHLLSIQTTPNFWSLRWMVPTRIGCLCFAAT